MCGIFVKTRGPLPASTSRAALAALARRGPDDHGVLTFPDCTLGQTRLAIIDLSPSGHQPMKDGDRDIAITFNGEIYNYQKLRKSFEEKGYRFHTDSDTEVILKAYQEYGANCPQHLEGMFAFVIWDNEQKKMFVARDRFGKKPLYYAYDTTRAFLAASEIKALTALGVRGELDPQGIDAYLALMYVPPWRTIYKNIHTVPPAHAGYLENGVLKLEQYWCLEGAPLSISYEEAKEEARRLINQAVTKRMIAADVEVGAFLSGGVDSSLITAYAQHNVKRPIKTFSLGYGEYINELPFAEQVAQTVGTDHHTLQAHTDLTNELEELYAYLDEPHADSANFAQHLLSKFTSTHVKVALAGDGGDELFMGYGWYWAYHNRPKLVTLKNALFSDQFTEYMKSVTVFPAAMRALFLKEHVTPLDMQQKVAHIKTHGAEKINTYDLTTYLPGQLLTKVDRTSMMHGLEVRCPLLDHELAEFAYRLPLEYKINHTTGKFILKDLLAEIMPRSFVDRKKQGFGAPVRKWLREEGMRTYVRSVFSDKALIHTILKPNIVNAFVEQTLTGDDQKSYYRLWVLLCLELWLKHHA